MDENQVVEPVSDQVNPDPQPENTAPVSTPTDNSRIMAIVAYFIFFLPLLTEYKDNDFVKFHVKQSILILILGVGISVISYIPVIGWFIGMLAWMALMILWVLGILNAAAEKKEPLPVIGKYAEQYLKF
ncbi:MAG: hypothetical protein UV00_C0008G0014 [candidate division WWE3 bacterium GW2011_GWF1_42_14]|uniref:Chloroplast import component protein (Tic20) n=2 Tax=Katanobacteria TaxID=422282 RepID=A0A0G0YN85_UNCKA|nr:MAG: hypothetical protein UU92_C0009G0014 [candidate division WWE3 bacterium GW2011_GWA1_42_12]KKS34779.1 MAG: hypothetical protein UU97_C0006G0018 [candidate division WWE3 bacterium GW2011_GWD1_42_14]KKS38182.1 MAG: hypothetical protein UV00_C0008G0014 [candidate division WWE3 bacterium GW2011_GWF1_42_14]KKS40319.1 MAG: hypothetical protein UV03_C0008G0014 [candidate division WWE3 bacterium GW2011_GWE1_42_16]KKS67154.1 MAG: hypothetical protein UV35_C0002G0014 [candidate division WWE3 bacte